MNDIGIFSKSYDGVAKSKKVRCVVLMTLMIAMLMYGGLVIASEGEHSEHEAAHKGWVATDTYRVMNFAVLAVALFFLLRKPVTQALDSRIKGIKEQLEELEKKKADAEKELAAYSGKLEQLNEEADKIIEEYIRQGNEAKARILKEAESTAEKLEEQAKKNIAYEFEQARKNLREDILEKAIAKAERMIKDRISTEDQERLVDEYLDKVVA
jgi:F-type H+-transporting ATPase subunit b